MKYLKNLAKSKTTTYPSLDRRPLLLNQPGKLLSPLSRRQWPQTIKLLQRIFHRNITRKRRRRMPRRHSRQRHSLSYQSLAPNAPLAAAKLLLIHQIADTAPDRGRVAAHPRSRQVRAVRQRGRTERQLMLSGGRSDEIGQGAIRQLVQLGKAGTSPHSNTLVLSHFLGV